MLALMTRHGRIWIAAAMAGVWATVTAAQSPILIGLVREDGHLIPIAKITGDAIEAPISSTTVNGEPVPPSGPEWPLKGVAWALSYGRNTKTATIRTLEPLVVDSHCTEQAVWRTTLKRPPVPENESPAGKIGIATSRIKLEHPIDVATQPDAASRRVAQRIVTLTHAKEIALVAAEPEWFPPPHPLLLGNRAQVAVRIEKLERHTIGGVSTYYFEATKAWDQALDNGLVTGWIVDSPSGLKDYEVQYKINDDTYKQNDRATVWGIVRHQGKSLWVLEWHGYEWEYYTVHEWPTGVELLNIVGGGC